jgi:hypothetical protein
MPYLIAILFVPLIAVLFYAFVLFDRLVRAEYEHHRPAWETDGRPAGFFWRAPECDFFLSKFARIRLTLGWLFRTPAWVVSSPALVAMLRRHRAAVLIWNIGVLVLFVLFVSALHD